MHIHEARFRCDCTFNIRGVYRGIPLTSSTCVSEEGEATSLGTREVSLIREDDCVFEGEDVLQKIHKHMVHRVSLCQITST